MNHFETSVTVDGDGGIHLAGLPFTPGTEVQIVINPKLDAGAVDAGAWALMTALDQGRNEHTVGPLRREELYDRNGLH
jgi:hypothetical protein